MKHVKARALLQSAIALQVKALDAVAQNSCEDILRAAELVAGSVRVIVTGVGKSAFIAQKFAASLTSIGLESRFMHPTDALHGDIGLVQGNEVLVLISKSGATEELIRLVAVEQLATVRRVLITANPLAVLKRENDVLIHSPVHSEYDVDNLLPTASTTIAMAIVDLVLACVASMRESTSEVLRVTHPNGAIGRMLTTKISDLLPTLPPAPCIDISASLMDAINILHSSARGIVCGVDAEGRLEGILTDGDVRRLVQGMQDVAARSLDDVAVKTPVTVAAHTTLHAALRMMEDRASKISVLPIVEADNKLIGVVHLHDIVSANQVLPELSLLGPS